MSFNIYGNRLASDLVLIKKELFLVKKLNQALLLFN